MAELVGYLRTVMVVAILGFILESLVPTGTFRGYFRLVVGLVLMVAMLNPLLAFLGHRLSLWPWEGGSWDRETASLLQEGEILAGERNRAIVDTFRSELERAATMAADGVPGVNRARVTVRLGEGDKAEVDAVTVAVQGTPIGDPRTWRHSIQSRVAASLGITSDRVTVRCIG